MDGWMDGYYFTKDKVLSSQYSCQETAETNTALPIQTGSYISISGPHQLRVAPGDAVAGNVAEVTASRDLDLDLVPR